MSRIDAGFARLRREKGKALIVYLTAGFPSLALLPDLVSALADQGVDLLELGVPFSDPLADGPTIQAASNWALARGVTPRGVLRAVEGLRRRQVILPIALMTYANPVFHYGIRRFCRDCLTSGVDGLILPDLPPEEAGELVSACRPFGINTIFLAAPTSTPSRMRTIARASSGFIYYVSLTGVTGARRSISSGMASHVRSLKRMTTLPVCVGFGISRPAHVREVVRVADGAIIGSALLDAMRDARSCVTAAARFIRPLRSACHA